MNDGTIQKPVVSIRGLSKKLGGRQILKDIDLDVYPGEIFGFLGPNGSGKTTTIKLMLGLLRLESGSISICGYDVRRNFENAVANIGGIIENPELYKYLTGQENLRQYMRMYGDGKVDEERIRKAAETVHLEARIGDKVSKYSLGMRQRLGLAQALIHQPRVLVLDEPTNGLDPQGIKELRDILLHMAHEENVAVFISSHQLAELDQMCDRIAIIDRGVVLSTMTIDEVRSAGTGKTSTLHITADRKGKDLPAEYQDVFTEKDGVLTGSVAREQIPDIVRTLVAAGMDLYSVVEEKHSIEDVFLQLTADYTPAGGGGTPGYAPKETKATEKKEGDVQ